MLSHEVCSQAEALDPPNTKIGSENLSLRAGVRKDVRVKQKVVCLRGRR